MYVDIDKSEIKKKLKVHLAVRSDIKKFLKAFNYFLKNKKLLLNMIGRKVWMI